MSHSLYFFRSGTKISLRTGVDREEIKHIKKERISLPLSGV